MKPASDAATGGFASIEELGPDALLAACEPGSIAGLTAAVRSRFPDLQVHNGERAVLIQLPPTLNRRGLLESLELLRPIAPAAAAETVVLRVRYDGPDLANVAAAVGISAAEVIALHSDREYESVFCGFAPGFSYLSGLDPALGLPRLATPRPRVPAGSVAIAAHYCAVYPTASPADGT